jgi:DNA-directed RNA polymerase subunit RPC12/RpoP
VSYLKEKVAYLKGLAEGMQINDASNEGKLLKAIIDVLDDIALEVDDIREVQEQLNEQVDNIDEDLAEVERIIFDDEEDYPALVECPYCHKEFEVDEDLIDDEGDTIECPHCHKKVDIDWDCECEECGDDDHDHDAE